MSEKDKKEHKNDKQGLKTMAKTKKIKPNCKTS
jgi:hypothetical protein